MLLMAYLFYLQSVYLLTLVTAKNCLNEQVFID
jgi:hypothetical protein